LDVTIVLEEWKHVQDIIGRQEVMRLTLRGFCMTFLVAAASAVGLAKLQITWWTFVGLCALILAVFWYVERVYCAAEITGLRREGQIEKFLRKVTASLNSPYRGPSFGRKMQKESVRAVFDNLKPNRWLDNERIAAFYMAMLAMVVGLSVVLLKSNAFVIAAVDRPQPPMSGLDLRPSIATAAQSLNDEMARITRELERLNDRLTIHATMINSNLSSLSVAVASLNRPMPVPSGGSSGSGGESPSSWNTWLEQGIKALEAIWPLFASDKSAAPQPVSVTVNTSVVDWSSVQNDITSLQGQVLALEAKVKEVCSPVPPRRMVGRFR